MNQLTDHEMELVRFSGLAEMQKHLRARRLAAAKTALVAAMAVAGCLLLLALTGCGTSRPNHECVLLKFPGAPSGEMVARLAATQPPADDAEIVAWFEHGETGFILSSHHTNEIAQARAEGATVKVLSVLSGSSLLAIYGKK